MKYSMKKISKVSIILNLYMPHKELLDNILTRILEQKTSVKIEIVFIDKKTDQETHNLISKFQKENNSIDTSILKVAENLSFASSMNAGIKKAKNNIIVILQQDCIPISQTWLQNLISPFEDSNVVATVSKVKFPDALWEDLSPIAQSIMLSEKGTICPLLDEKACAYRKEVLEKVGFFNDRDFHTAGEDFDMYIKLSSQGKIEYPDATIIHNHPTNLSSRLKKVGQYANGFGTLIRKHGKKMPRWYSGLIKATPLIGMFFFLVSYPFKKGILLYPLYIMMTPLIHYIYVKGFWKGYISRSQSIDIFPTKIR